MLRKLSASGKPRLHSYLRRCFAEIGARTQYPAPNPNKNTAKRGYEIHPCCSRSNEQHGDPHDEIQPAGGHQTDGSQKIHDHPFASRRRTPFGTKPSSRSDAGRPNKSNFWAALSWTAKLLQQRESDASACEAQPLSSEDLASLVGRFAWLLRVGVSVPSLHLRLERKGSILIVLVAGVCQLADSGTGNNRHFILELLLVGQTARRPQRAAIGSQNRTLLVPPSGVRPGSIEIAGAEKAPETMIKILLIRIHKPFLLISVFTREKAAIVLREQVVKTPLIPNARSRPIRRTSELKYPETGLRRRGHFLLCPPARRKRRGEAR